MPTITLVTGPPCAGKTTWVQQHAHPGDLIVCHDTYAQQAGSPEQWNHHRTHNETAGQAWRAQVQALAGQPPTRDTWVIRCAPTAAERDHLARRIRAHRVVVLMPPRSIALDRAHQHSRDRQAVQAIRRWYQAYSPSPAHQVIDTSTSALPTW